MSSDSQNPFASPSAKIDVNPASQGQLVPASQGKRFLNLIIDSIALYGVNYAVGMAAGLAYGASMNGNITQEQLATFQIAMFFVGLSVQALYYTVFEAIFGITLGKLVTGTRVVAADGSLASGAQIFGRSLCRFIPFEAFSFFGGAGRPVGWHDSISGTRVIETR